MIELYNADCLEKLDELAEGSVDAIVTDPPYELNFMSKGWDNAGVSFSKKTWAKCLRVLKPGGYLLAFGGSRTYHRIACAIEDGGFEIRDCIMWLYGSGFPKSMNIGLAVDKKNGIESKVVGKGKSGSAETHTRTMHSQTLDGKDVFGGEFDIKQAQNEWAGWGTALKPSYEPIIMARKPFKGSCVDNVLEHGVGGINIDECRVGSEKLRNSYAGNKNSGFTSADDRDAKGKGMFAGKKKGETIVTGRFPANTLLTYDETDYDEVCGGFPNSKGGSGKGFKKNDYAEKETATNFTRGDFVPYNDNGSASRYFYCAKASKKDRDEGLDNFKTQKTGDLQGGRKDGSAGSIMKNADGGTRVNPYAGTGAPKKNTHPTVKPTELMQYLIRLVAPKGSTILDPFMGSGSTGKAVMFENKERNADYSFIGIEKQSDYCEIAKARIDYARK